MNRFLSVVRSMIDKIIELSRAVVNEARYGESIGGAASIRTPERRSCHLASTLRRPATGPGDVGSVCWESDCRVRWPFAWRRQWDAGNASDAFDLRRVRCRCRSWRSPCPAPHRGGRHESANALHGAVAAVRAQGDVDAGETQQHGLRRFRLARWRCGLFDQSAAQGELAVAAPIGEQAVVAQPGEAARQDMRQEPPDELVGIKTHGLVPIAVGVVAPLETDVLAVKVDEAVVGDGDLVGVAPEIGQDMRGARERRLGVDHPVVGSQCGRQVVEVVGVGQAQFAAAMGLGEEVQVLAAEDLSGDMKN